ncbi:MAG: hypothetical protein CVV07_00360 [Gammaproteobacteria bacterium HGW-Gammaproteobacteria-11]|nr:MAG: hypothetical protein CVV07_00360 [Gammaproteobacteria bacterium HGW-Gammaproteobacteria-11]
MIIKILFFSLKKKFLLFSFFSIVFFSIWYAIAIGLAVSSWELRKSEFNYWKTSQQQFCSNLISQAEFDIEEIDQSRCNIADGGEVYFSCIDRQRLSRDAIIQGVYLSKCPFSSVQHTSRSDLPKLGNIPDPGNLYIYTLNRYTDGPFSIFIYHLMVVCLLVLISDAIKTIYRDENIGWKRLMLVLSVIVGLFFSWWWYHSIGYDYWSAVKAFIIGSFFAGIALIYLKKTFFWVLDGFLTNKNAAKKSLFSEDCAVEYLEGDNKNIINYNSKNFPGKNEGADVSQVKFAKYWPRAFARCIDLSLCIIADSLIYFALPFSLEDPQSVADLFILYGASFFSLCATIFIYEYILVVFFGKTLGKLMFGLSVKCSDLSLPSKASARLRAWVFIRSGLYFCLAFPFFQFASAFIAWRRGDDKQPWDMSAKTRVYQSPVGFARIVFSVITAILIFLLVVTASRIANEQNKEKLQGLVEKSVLMIN